MDYKNKTMSKKLDLKEIVNIENAQKEDAKQQALSL